MTLVQGAAPITARAELARGPSAANRPDPLLLALARYVQALEERYPGGLEQVRSEGLADRANMPSVTLTRGPAK